jgi:hypothetical protein
MCAMKGRCQERVRCPAGVLDSYLASRPEGTDLQHVLGLSAGTGRQGDDGFVTHVKGDGRSTGVGDTGVGREGTNASLPSAVGREAREVSEEAVASEVVLTLVAATAATATDASVQGGGRPEGSMGPCTAPKVTTAAGGGQEGEWCL